MLSSLICLYIDAIQKSGIGGGKWDILQLDEAMASASTPTKLARNLLTIFYTPEELAGATACGRRGKYKAIDKSILSAIIRKFLFF